MHHYYQIADADLPMVEDAPPLRGRRRRRRPATERELRNMNLFRVATADNGDGIFLVACVDPCEGHPGTELASGFWHERHGNLPDAARGRVLRARVYRARDRRVNLREQIERDEGETIEARKRAPEAVRERLRDRVARETDPALDAGPDRPGPVAARTIDRLELAMDDVADGDVVDEDGIYPLSMAGEIKTR